MNPGVASISVGDGPAAAKPNTRVVGLALGMACAGLAGWATILTLHESHPGGDLLHEAGVVALMLATLGLLAGGWAWQRWRLDILAQQTAEAQLNHFHSVMSVTNRLILTRPDPRQLFEGVCEVCVEAGRADLAVVDMADTGEAHRASAGTLAGVTVGASRAQRLDGERLQQLMIVLVERAGRPVVVDDAMSDARLSGAQSWCRGTGLCSMTAIPLRRGGVLVGILLLSSRSRSFFGVRLTPLLAELGADLSFALDNSDRERERQAAALLDRARLSAEDASRAKTEFLAQMSHELRTPLNAILGFAQLLATDPVDVLSAGQTERVRLITHAGWHLLGLVNDVMDIALIESRRFEVCNVGGDISTVLAEAVALTQPLASTCQVELAARPTSPFGVGAVADPRRLLQVLLNLLSNACKYNRPGGHVKVEVAHSGSEVFLDVIDNGIGMTKEQLSHLFEPFNRLGQADCAIEGSGIGLALALQLTALMNGRLEFESTSGTGTRARLILPTYAIPLIARASNDEVARTVTRLQADAVVLYIEDDLVNQLLVEQMLMRCTGVILVLAQSGQVGISLARLRKPDLVLLDMQLPDMSGFDVLGVLRADSRTEALRVVVLSANGAAADLAKEKALGVVDHWEKPLKLAPFLAGITKLLGLDDSAAGICDVPSVSPGHSQR
jgi:signal transduction histidine kinase/ActR/RegA family two-component response regulator